MKTQEFKKAVQEFEEKGFIINEYETEKRNIEHYKSQLIKELNVLNIDMQYKNFNFYTFEDVEKGLKEFFKDSVNIRKEQLFNRFFNYDRTFFNTDIVGYNDNLKISFEELNTLINKYIDLKGDIIRVNLYNTYNKERTINDLKADFKQFCKLNLNIELKEEDYKLKEYKEHIVFKLLNKTLIKENKELIKKYLQDIYKKAFYYNIADLPQVIKESDLIDFIIITKENKQYFYTLMNQKSFNKVNVKALEINDYDINAHIYISELKTRWNDEEDLFKYCERKEEPLKEETKKILRDLKR